MDEHDSIPVVMNVEVVAKILNVGKNTVYNLIHSGAIKSVYIGRQIRITRKALLEYLDS